MSDPSSSSAPRAPWGRLAVTIALLLVVGLMPAIGLPGVDTSGLPKFARSIDVFGLGFMPFISAAIVVELAAVVVPRWRSLRHGGPEGRGKLGRATFALALGLSAFQAYGITTLIQQAELGLALRSFSVPMVLLTMTAGTFLLGLLAQVASTHGLASGFVLLLASLPAIDATRAMVSGKLEDTLTTRELAAFAVGITIVAVATWALLRARTEAPPPERREPTYRVPPNEDPSTPIALPAPASGLAPLIGATALVSLPPTLAYLGAPTGELSALLARETVHRAVMLVFIALLGAFFAAIFNAPPRVAALAVRAGADRALGDLEAEARVRLREATLRSVLYGVALFAIAEAVRSGVLWIKIAVTTAMATALVLDLVAEWRARRTIPDLVPIWPEHRPYALPAARAALSAAGIAVHARGEHVRRLLQFGGSFVPIDLMVSSQHAKRAAKILKKLLGYRPEDEAMQTKPTSNPPRWTRWESSLATTALLLAGGTMLLPVTAPPPPESHAPARPEALQLLPLDDDADPFDQVGDELPNGVSIVAENVPLGVAASSPRTAVRGYARMVKDEHETMEQASARLLAWASTRDVPEGDRVLVGALMEYDDEKDRFEQVGWRTYVARTQPVVDGSNVRHAVAQPDLDADRRSARGWHVRVEFDAAGAERFQAFTRENIKRRLAIVVDGKVESAPVIQTEIPGGVVTITVGTGDPAQQLRDAQKLEKRLLGR